MWIIEQIETSIWTLFATKTVQNKFKLELIKILRAFER